MSYKMSRGVSQSLYKYLPESWIDFAARGDERHNYIAKVKRWNSVQLENVNRKRLLRIVNKRIKQFSDSVEKDGSSNVKPTSGFGTGLSVENCRILEPKHNTDERGIVAQLDPVTFYCPKCNRVYQFNGKEGYDKLRGKCVKCKIELKQFRLVYYCKCGWSSSRQPVYCSTCGTNEHIRWSGEIGDYNFRCSKCHRRIPMRVKCNHCSEFITPRVALDSSQYYPKTVDLIDIIDEKTERFVSEVEEGAFLVIARWLGMLNGDELDALIEKGKLVDSEEYQRVYDLNYQTLIAGKLDEEMAKNLTKTLADQQCGTQFNTIVDSIKSRILCSKEECNNVAEEILEFIRVQSIERGLDLNGAISTARLLNTSANPERYPDLASEKGISDVKVYSEIPFVTCAYGYTRVESEPKKGVQLRAFAEEENGIRNIYATKLKTEGILIEFDRKKILKWLIKNQTINEDLGFELDDENAVKMWFINNIKSSYIQPYNELDVLQSKETYFVYNLIHTISHVLIKSAANKCGLSKDSLSEYIMPNIPAVLIYCQNSQGFNLGALFNLFEAYFDKWMIEAYEEARKCIFDPICIEKYKSCGGCVYLNEISCQHFNHDLDRSMLIGHYERITKKQFYGFWE